MSDASDIPEAKGSVRGRRFQMAAKASITSVQIHCTARNLTSLASDGKSVLKTTISWPGLELAKGLDLSIIEGEQSWNAHREHVVDGSLSVT